MKLRVVHLQQTNFAFYKELTGCHMGLLVTIDLQSQYTALCAVGFYELNKSNRNIRNRVTIR